MACRSHGDGIWGYWASSSHWHAVGLRPRSCSCTARRHVEIVDVVMSPAVVMYTTIFRDSCRLEYVWSPFHFDTYRYCHSSFPGLCEHHYKDHLQDSFLRVTRSDVRVLLTFSFYIDLVLLSNQQSRMQLHRFQTPKFDRLSDRAVQLYFQLYKLDSPYIDIY